MLSRMHTTHQRWARAPAGSRRRIRPCRTGILALPAVGLAVSVLRRAVEPARTALPRDLSLLFVPAAVGVVQVSPQLAGQGLAIAASILVSIVAALAITALAAVKRLDEAFFET